MGNIRKQRRKNNKLIAQQRRDKDDADEHCLANLSPHIILQILLKLPQEQLFNLRRACKEWNDMISSSRFVAREYSQRHTSALLVQVPVRYGSEWKTKVLEFGAEGLDFELSRVGPNPRMGEIKSVSNGLILVLEGEALAVVNMATDCWVSVPECPTACEHDYHCLALVFDARAKQYKVVHVGPFSSGIEVFTLGCPGGEWRTVPSSFNGTMHDEDWAAPVFTNGRFLHWDVSSDLFIVSLDAFEETTSKTSLPFVTHLHPRNSLVELRGSLCLMAYHCATQLDAWVLEDVAGQIWRRSFSIVAEMVNYPLPDGTSPGKWRNPLPYFGKLQAVCSLRDGEIIVFKHLYSLWLYVYERKVNEWRKLKRIPAKQNEIFSFKSSLVHWDSDEQLFARETI